VSGLGLAAVGAGGAFGAVALSESSAADDAPEQTVAWSRYEDARGYATVANVCFIGGGVVLAAGVVWVLLSGGGGDVDAEEDEGETDLVLRPDGIGIRF
jgi:hypothetical protein